MIRNSAYLAWGRKKYGKQFIFPDDLDQYRKKKGMKQRPRQFKIY